jgi:hypothetical protein
MKTFHLKKVIVVMLIIGLTTTTTVAAFKTEKIESSFDDIDPLVDLIVTVEIKQIRSFDKIDRFSKPDFFVKIFINDAEFVSCVWHNMEFIYDPQWSATCNVPDDEEFVDITIQLWDWNAGMNKLCDISSDYEGHTDSFDVELIYDLKTGNWFGDDYTSDEPTELDPSGYGRLNGCDDGSIYQQDRDCELWFDIYQNDYDGDDIPYWSEVNIYETNPEIDNSGEDYDNDSVPIEWEHKWGQYFAYDWHDDIWIRDWYYSPFEDEHHIDLDIDRDGLDNIEEYLTSEWGSDPFRKDLFIELDQMDESPRGEKSLMPEGSKELLRTAYDRQNIVYHLDDGCMSGGEIIPFAELVDHEGLQQIYLNYFLHGDENNWRRGVFHYGLVVYQSTYAGFVFWGGVGPYLDSFQISSKNMEKKAKIPFYKRDIVYASGYMHETGHTLGIFHGNTPGCDDHETYYPWQKNYWKWGPYKSTMNYRYTYRMVDYSDGSRGKNDFDDWNRLDLTFFQRAMW